MGSTPSWGRPCIIPSAIDAFLFAFRARWILTAIASHERET